MDDIFRVVSATRVAREDFAAKTALGRSLQLVPSHPKLELELYCENSEGLSSVYNRAIFNAQHRPAVLVFVHDDVYIADPGWITRAQAALGLFDVVGVAGNKRRVPGQPAWPFVDARFTWDASEHLSGMVGHGEPPGNFSDYGPVHQRCKLLDGVMLVCQSEKLKATGLLFDPQFDFHFYDMDFCRQAELKQMTLGTGGFRIIHQSAGAFGSPAWQVSYQRYLQKYGD